MHVSRMEHRQFTRFENGTTYSPEAATFFRTSTRHPGPSIAVSHPRRNLRSNGGGTHVHETFFQGVISDGTKFPSSCERRIADIGRKGGIDQLIPLGYSKEPLTHPLDGTTGPW